MGEYVFYITLGVVLIIAIQFFRGGHLMLAAATLAVGAWVIYTKDNPVDIKESIYQSIDEGAKSDYERRGLKTQTTEEDIEKSVKK